MGETMPKYMAERLKELRVTHHLTFEQVGKVVGRSGNTIRSWEARTAAPHPTLLIKLSDFYSVPIESFYHPEASEEDSLSEEERFIVKRYRDMSPLDKRLFYRFAMELTERNEEYEKRLVQCGIEPATFYAGVDLEGGLK